MAFPRDRFGAHDGGPLRRGEGDETFDGRPEFRRGHVIRIAAESRAPPSRVHAVRRGFAEAAKGLEVLVPDAALAQRGSQGGLLGPRRSLRGGEVADIREELDSVRLEKREELIERARRVADGPDGTAILAGETRGHRTLMEVRSCMRGREPDTASRRWAGRSR